MEQKITIDNSPIIKDSISIADIKKIILIDETIENKQIFFSSNNNETLPIYYNYYTDRDKLFEYLEKEFINIDRIAIIFNNSMMNNKYFLNNELFFTENDIIQFENNKECLVDDYSSNVSFLIKTCKKFNVKNIDFLACNSLEYSNWQNYYEILNYYLGEIIGASTDLTGNVKYGGNWIMENTKEDIQNIYFNENITNYSSTLFSSSITYFKYQFYGSNFFSVKVKNVKINSIITLTNFTNFNFFNGSLTPSNPTKNYVLYYRNVAGGNFTNINNTNMNITILPNDEYEILVAFETSYYIAFGNIVNQNTLLISDNYLSLYAGLSGNNNDKTSYNKLSPNDIYASLIFNYQLSYTLNYTYTLIPTITNFSIPTKTYGDIPFQITQPTSNSSGSFSYTSSNLSVATISGNTITIVGAGSSTITATQVATADYTSVSTTITFQVNQSTPTNPVIIDSDANLLYLMNTSSTYANITNSLEINYDLIASSYKVLTGNNITITKSNN